MINLLKFILLVIMLVFIYNFFIKNNSKYIIVVDGTLISGYSKAYGSPEFKSVEECNRFLKHSYFKVQADKVHQIIFCGKKSDYDNE